MYSVEDLQRAATAGLLSEDQLPRLLDFLAREVGAAQPAQDAQFNPQFSPQFSAQFSMVHVLYYLGGLLALSAVSFFVTLAWSQMGDGVLLALSLSLLVLFAALTQKFLKLSLRVPAGLMSAVTLACVPLAVFAAQRMAGLWTGYEDYVDYHRYIDWRWLSLEVSTIIAALILLYLWRLPFLLMPTAITLWYMGMDLVPFLFHWEYEHWDFTMRAKFTALYGGVLILIAFWVDLRARRSEDFAFWLYLAGVVSFWGGLSCMDSGSEWGKFVYCLINLAMLFIGVVLQRRVFAVFGAFGIFGYLGYLAWNVFADSLLFPIALIALGLGIIAFAVWFSRHEAALKARWRTLLPQPMRELLDKR